LRFASWCVGAVTRKELLAQRRHRDQVGFRHRQRQQPGVDPAAPDLLDGLPRQRDGQPDVQVRVDPPEVLQQRREHVQTNRHPTREPQRPPQVPGPIGNRPDGLAHVEEHALTELNEALRCRRHPDLAAYPEKQRLTEFLFEEKDLAADRRLRDMELSSRTR